MRTEKDVEAYLLRLQRRFSIVEERPTTFLLETIPDMPKAAVRVDPPLVVIRVHIGLANGPDDAGLFRRLLELNAQGLVHSNYGLEGSTIVLSSALELENLDFNEIAATLDEIDMALAQQVPMLAGLNKAKEGA